MVLQPPAQDGISWHNHHISPNFTLLDPIKVTIISPDSIPAIILTKYFSEHGINVQITGFYTIQLLFTIGMTKGRWNTILSTLQQFKMDHDSNRPLWRIMPKLSNKYCYGNDGPADVCKKVKEYYIQKDVLGVLLRLNEYPTLTLLPCKAFEQIARRNTERVPILAF